MINPHWLASFAALTELGSFTRSAERLGLTQAAVSQHIRQLESRYGTLLIRKPRGIELTPAGQALLAYCTDLEGAERRLRIRLADLQAEGGEVGLVTPGSIGLLLSPLLLDLQERHRDLVIRHRFAPDHEVLEAVLRNRYDLGLVTAKPDDPRLRVSPFARETLELVLPAGCHAERWDDLHRLGFVDHPDGKAMAALLLNRHFPDNPGVNSLPVRGFSNQIALILEPVARGLGFTVIPSHARQAFARPDALHVVDCRAPVVNTLWLIHRAEWPLSGAARTVVAALQEAMA